MQYSVGDRVVHPGIGAGRIVGTRRQELVEGFSKYFVIEMPGRDSMLYIPMRMMDDVGIRPVMTEDRLARVLDTLVSEPQSLPESYRERQEQAEEKLSTGQPLQIAEVIRDLVWHERVAHLTKRDNRILDRARTFLVGEIALVADAEPEEVSEIIDQALAVAMPEEGGEDEDEPGRESADAVGPSDGQGKTRSVLVSLKNRVTRLILHSD